MAGDIQGPTVKIGADASAVDTVLKSIPGKFQQLQTEVTGLGGKFEQVGQSMSQVGIYATAGITAPMAAAVGAVGLMTNQAVAFSGQMGEVYTLLPNLSADAKAKMSADVKALSSEYGIMSEDVVPALYQALSSGVPPDNVMSFLGTAAQTSIGGCTDLTSAVDVLSSSVNAYGSDVLSAQQASDILFTGVRMGKTTMSDLSANMSKVAPVAAALKIPLDQVVGSLDAMTLQGEPTAEAATKIKSMLAELSLEGSKSAEIFEQLSGKSFSDFIKGGGTLQEALKIMAGASSQYGGSIKNEFGSIEAGMAALMLTSESGSKAYDSAMAEMAKSTGAMSQAYKEMSQTAQQQLNQLKADIHNQVLEIGEAFLPVLQNDILPIVKNDIVPLIKDNVIPAIKDFAEWFNKLDEPARRAAIGLGIFAGAIGPLLMVLGPIVSAGGSLVSGLTGISTAAAAIKGAGAAAEIGAIGTAAMGAEAGVAGFSTVLIGLPAAAVVGGLLAAYATNFGDFRDNVNSVIADLGRAAGNIQSGNYEEAGRNCAEAFGDGFETASDLITAVIEGLPSAISGAGSFISGAQEVGREFGEGIGRGSAEGIASLSGPVADAIRLITSENAAKNEIPAAIRGWFSGITLEAEGANLGQTLLNGFLGVNFSPLSDVITGAISGAADVGVGIVKQKMADIYGISLSDVNAALAGNGWGGDMLASMGNPAAPSNPVISPVTGQPTQGTTIINVPAGWTPLGGTPVQSPSSVSPEQAAIQKYADDNKLSYESAEKMYNASENFRKSLTSSGSTVSTAANNNAAALNTSTQAQNQQAKSIQDIIKGATSWEDASQKAAKAGYSTSEALDAWNNRLGSAVQTTSAITNQATTSLQKAQETSEKTTSAL